jgi:DUF438 domain-containing protein
MKLDKLKGQHTEILSSIDALRETVRQGIAENAMTIVQQLVHMSGVISLHLSMEDRFLYPELQKQGSVRLASMGRRFQDEMAQIAAVYGDFVKKWNVAGNVAANPEGFRADANRVLKTLFERMQRENRDFYPAIEAA